jgi:hypothetical protein
MPRPRFTLRWLLLATAVLATFFYVASLLYSIVGPIAPSSAIAQLQPGMKAAEVERLLGRPTSVEGGYWLYGKPMNLGWLGIGFDEKGELVGYDHETVLP